MTEPVVGAGKAVVEAAVKAAPAADKAADAAKVVAENGDDAAKVAGAATRALTGMSGTNIVGLGAGAAGILLTLYNTYNESIGKQGLNTGSLFGPTTFAIGGGSALMILAEKGVNNRLLSSGMRGAGLALVLGGLAGAVAGTMRNVNAERDTMLDSPLVQAPTKFNTDLPSVPMDLRGVEVATGEAVDTKRTLQRSPMYIDASNARKLDVTSLGDAIAHARAAAQEDDKHRSEAVLQTADGAYWIAQLAGDLDQIDGPNYDDGNDLDRRFPPTVIKKQAALQAIVGVESRFVFPAEQSDTAAVQETGAIPWLTPGGDSPTTSTPDGDDS